jgi:hypothetical protein
LQAKVIHAYKKLEEIQRDLIELNKLKERIAEDRDYSGFLKESFQREIQKITGYQEEILNLTVESSASYRTDPSLDKNSKVDGQKLYAEKESSYRNALAQEQSTEIKKDIKKKTERPVYKY